MTDVEIHTFNINILCEFFFNADMMETLLLLLLLPPAYVVEVMFSSCNLVWFVWGQCHKWGQGHSKVKV